MGLIKAALGAAGGVLADQWKEYFYCDALPETVLAVKGKKRVSSRSSNKGSDNVISSGSVVAVADGQCMLIVDQGKIAEVCAEAGEFVYDASTEPSVFSGALGQSVKDSFAAMGRRFAFGGDTGKDQRVYYINTKELYGNKYGTPTPVPFRVVDEDIGFRTTISIRCFGEYSYHVCDPILFYKNVCGNFADSFTRDRLDSMLKSELMTALQPAFGKMSAMGIGYTELPLHTMDIANALNEILSEQWRAKRGLEIVSFGVSSVSATEADEKRLKDMQQSVFLGGGNAAAGRMVDATANAMEAAARNTATGPMMAFAGMNMAGSAGTGSMQGLFQQNQGTPYQGGSRGGYLEVPRLRYGGYRQLLPGVRRQKARRWLDLQVRRGEQRQVLYPVWRKEACGRAPLQVRQVRLGAGRSQESAQVLPRVRRPLQ